LSDESRVHNSDLCDQGHDWSPYCRYDDMQKLEHENQRLREQLEFALNPIHTCHDNCPRIACVMRRERDQWKTVAQELAEDLRFWWEPTLEGHFHPDNPTGQTNKALAAFDKLNTP